MSIKPITDTRSISTSNLNEPTKRKTNSDPTVRLNIKRIRNVNSEIALNMQITNAQNSKRVIAFLLVDRDFDSASDRLTSSMETLNNCSRQLKKLKETSSETRLEELEGKIQSLKDTFSEMSEAAEEKDYTKPVPPQWYSK